MKHISYALILLAFYLLVGFVIWMTKSPWWIFMGLFAPVMVDCECDDKDDDN